MKSINEFATEYAQDKYLPVQTSQAVKAGANYVLMEILDKTSKCITIKDAYEAFLECVEQLKK